MNKTAAGVIEEVHRFLGESQPLLDNPDGFKRPFVDQLHDLGAFQVFVPPENGGLYRNYSESMALVSTAAGHSLELSLMLGITSSLFLMPVARYAAPEVRNTVLTDFLQRRLLAGMMMTEPDYGTNIMGIQTSFQLEGTGYRIKGAKHWAGLSGMGDYWLVSARKAREAGTLGREVDFFIVRSDQPGYNFEQTYPAAGLAAISYGLTRFDVHVPGDHKLCGPGTNIRVLYDILNRSRISISSIATGATRRLLNDAESWCAGRVVFGKPLAAYEQVQHRLAALQAAATICDAACTFAGALLDAHQPAGLYFEMLVANIIKVTTTDLLQMAAQSAVQLRGGQGFRKDHYTGKAFTDSRPFQIFEGSNDVLYEAIAAQLIGEARPLGLATLREALALHPTLPLPCLPADPMDELQLELTDSQIDRVLLGKIISRYAVIGILQQVAAVNTRLRPAVVDSAIAYLRAELEWFQHERCTGFRPRYLA